MPANNVGDLARRVHEQLLPKHKATPTLRILEMLFDALYFASLKHEEGQPISCRIAFIEKINPDPEPPKRIVADRWRYFPLAEALPLTVRNLVKLSKAVDPWSSTLAVDTDVDGKLRIWGLVDQSVHYSAYVVKEADAGPEMPGMFQAVIEGVGEIAAYSTYALLGWLKQDVLITRQQRVFQTGPIRSKLRVSIRKFRQDVLDEIGEHAYNLRGHWNSSLGDLWVSAICRILIGIQRYGHGGAVLISGSASRLNPKYSLAYSRLATSIRRVAVNSVQNANYSDEIYEKYLDRDKDEIPALLYLNETVSENDLKETEDELTGCIRFVASLSRVDGLVWLEPNLTLRAFGVEVKVKSDPSGVRLAQNSKGTHTKTLDLNHFGMRHRSMMRYCATNPKSVGFVVSQDGEVRAVTQVRGRVFLWDNIRIRSILNPIVTRSKQQRGSST